jgi:hypothetical protein
VAVFHDLRVSAQARLAWLALTPEPERELPSLVAALRCARGPATATDFATAKAAEAARVDRLVLHGTARSWRRYLHEVTELIRMAGPFAPPDVTLAAAEVVLDHHRMLIGLPGDGYRRTAADRAALTTLLDARIQEQEKGR